MGTAGIKKALVKGVNLKKIYRKETLIELDENTTFFTAFIDKSCLGINTTNPETTIKEVKWFLIREHLWYAYKNIYKDLSPSVFFETILLQLKQTDYKILEGNDQLIDKNKILGTTPKGNLGVVHMIMPYTNFPEDSISNIYTVVLDKPQVLYALFKFPDSGYIPLEDNIKKAAYGQTVEIEVYTHLLPDPRNNTEKFDYKIELINRGNVVATSSSQTILNKNQYNYNQSASLKLLIDPDWQKNHQDENKNEEYYIKLNGFIGFTSPVFMPAGTLTTKGEFNSQESRTEWGYLENGKWVYDKSNVLYVPFDTFSDMMSRFQVEINNAIQYIGDVEYTEKEHNPCAFSIITVNNGEKDFEIFNENKLGKLKGDKTFNSIDIIAGDNKKQNVKITAKFIGKDGKKDHIRTNKNGHKCDMILNDNKFHNGLEDVFKMGWIVGQWKPSLEYSFNNIVRNNLSNGGMFHLYQPENYLHAPKFKTDQEAKGIPVSEKEQAKYKPLTVAGIQRLTENDYVINENDDSITLKLAYKYNKTVAEGTVIENKILDNLWLFRYFTFNENKAQTYFVPVTTCRYPNQIAKIRVFPDIAWGISFTIGFIDKKYKEDWREDLTEEKKKLIRYAKYDLDGADLQTRITKEKGYFEGKEKKEKEEEDRKKKSLLKRLNFKLGINVKYNNEVIDFSPKLGKDLETLLYTVGIIKETFDEVVGNGEDSPSPEEKEKKYLESIKKSKFLKGLAKLPISITVDYPALTGGVVWSFRELKTRGNVTTSYDIFLKASPLLSAEGKLDLIPLAKYIPVFGQAAEVVRIILEVGGVHPDCFISAKGEIGFGFTLKIGEDNDSSQGTVGFDGDFKLRVEASVTVDPGVIGFIFSGGSAESLVTSTEYRAYGETGLTGNLLSGADEKGPYLELSVDFSGLNFVAEKKIKDEDTGASKTKKLGPYVMVKQQKLFGGKKYLIEEKQ